MNPRVKHVKAEENYRLKLTFENGEVRVFDLRPYLSIGVFRRLKEPVAFRSVHAAFGSVQWKGGQDLCPDTLYEESKPYSRVESAVAVHEKPAVYKLGKGKNEVKTSK